MFTKQTVTPTSTIEYILNPYTNSYINIFHNSQSYYQFTTNSTKFLDNLSKLSIKFQQHTSKKSNTTFYTVELNPNRITDAIYFTLLTNLI